MEKNKFVSLATWLKKAINLFTYDQKLNKIPEQELISIKDLATLIQTVYSNFKKDYKELEKLDIGNNNNIISYDTNDNYRILSIQLNEQEETTLIPDGFHYLNISELNGETLVYVNDTEIFYEDRKTLELKNIDSKIVTGYLDIFEKYYPIFKLYVDLQANIFLASNRSHYLMMNMCTNNDSLINGLNGIEYFINSFNEMGNNYIIKIYVDLRNGVKIDYNKSQIIIDDLPVKKNSTSYTKILKQAFECVRFNRSSLSQSGFIEYAEKQAQSNYKKRTKN